MANRSVAIVHLGRAGGLGTHRRVESLTALFETAGAEVTTIALRAEHPAKFSDALRPGVVPLLTGRSVPETLAWSPRGVHATLQDLGPEVVVCITGRAYHPDLARGPWRVVLDFVDRLSDSYRDRARILGRTGRAFAYHVLAHTAQRQEHAIPVGVTAIAAGWTDARTLGVEWVPITVEVPADLPPGDPDHDVVFFGTLSYEPNVEAVRRLARLWPSVLDARPDARMLVAGATPLHEVEALAARCGWTLLADVSDVTRTLRRARIAVVPLLHASGLQIKVLEAAASGLAQVVDPVALGGFTPGFPAVVAHDDEEFSRSILKLLANEVERTTLATRARDIVASDYSVTRWTPWAASVLENAQA